MNFFKRTVASITKSLAGMAEELYEHAAAKDAEKSELYKKSDALIAQAVDASSEAERARKVAMRISSLID